jgi:predicted methyltransferase
VAVVLTGSTGERVVLDLFFGLGYSAQEACELGAERVVCFEVRSIRFRVNYYLMHHLMCQSAGILLQKYEEVLALSRKNPFSPDLSTEHRITTTVQDLAKSNAFFSRVATMR